jgi:hypothetical protein
VRVEYSTMTDYTLNGNGSLGQVLRASTVGFVFSPRHNKIDERQTFGVLVKSPISDNRAVWVIGLIYAIEIKDDPLARELAIADIDDYNVLHDHRENRMIPMEIKALSVGYTDNGHMVHSLPPRPPMSLSEVELCSAEEVYRFTSRCDYIRLVLGASEVPSDDLIASTLRYASSIYVDDHERYNFLVSCGRSLARFMSNDPARLSHVLALIRP